MSRQILGIHIDTDAISGVMLRTTLSETAIESWIRIPITPSQTDAADAPDPVEAAMTELVEKISPEGAHCTVAVPAHRISYRNLEVPFKSRKRISQILPFELEPTLPFPMDELIIDFQPFAHVKDPDQTELLTMSLRKRELEGYLTLLAGARINPQTIGISGYTTAAYIGAQAKETQTSWCLLDIGSATATLFVVINGGVQHVRSQEMHIGPDASLQELLRFTRQTIFALEDRLSSAVHPERIVLSGAGAGDLTDAQIHSFGQALGIETERGNLLANADQKRIPSPPDNWAPAQMDHALAMALASADGRNGVNFRKGPYALSKNWGIDTRTMIQIGVFLTLILIMFVVNMHLKKSVLAEEQQRLDQEIHAIFRDVLPEVTRIVDPRHQLEVALEEKRKNVYLPGESIRGARVIDILDQLSKAIPENVDVEFTRLVAGENDILISGDTDNFNTVDEIQNRLEQAALFSKVTISSTNKDATENRVRFKLKVDL